MAGEKAPNTTSTTAAKEPSVLSSIARHIPGFNPPPPTQTKTRSRAKKTKQPTAADATGAEAGATAGVPVVADVAQTEVAAVAAPKVEDNSDLVVEEKKTSAVEACSKRIRAANKKLRQIASYEEKTDSLNADQQRAVASKPTLQAVVKELEELLTILKAEDAEDEARNGRVAGVHEKQNSRAIESAVQDAKKQSEQDLVLLFQFLHLHGLYSPSESQGFAPPQLPPVVANATGEEVAAVRMLYDQFTNGPLLGGHGDALEKLSKLGAGSNEELLGSVSFARVKELIAGLTSTAADQTSDDVVLKSNSPAGPSDSVTALVDGATDSAAPSFLNESELPQQKIPSTEEKVSSWADDVTPVAPVAQTTAAESNHNLPGAQQIEANGHAAEQGAAPATTIDWANEDSGALPSLPELQQRPPVAPSAAEAHVSQLNAGAVPAADGFITAAPGRGGRGGQRGGATRGNYRGNNFNSEYRGGRGGAPPFRGRSDGSWARQPREESAEGGAQTAGSAGRGNYRGSNYRGNLGQGVEGRGRGRGSFRGARGAFNQNSDTPSSSPAAAAAPAPAVPAVTPSAE